MAAPASRHNPVEEDTEQLAMSTLSFQDYVRERMLRRRHEAMNGPSTPPTFAERSRDQDRDFPRSALLPLRWYATTRCAPSPWTCPSPRHGARPSPPQRPPSPWPSSKA